MITNGSRLRKCDGAHARQNSKKLEQIAAGVDRSINRLINQAIENYLEVYDWREKRIRERLKKAEKGGKFYTTEQINDVIESFKPWWKLHGLMKPFKTSKKIGRYIPEDDPAAAYRVLTKI